ncbi:ribulokinase [Peribacillus glennii]|uniref:Ribulokinase n=1 Tax=Peribacillus glennii TaxID=2303991 RepID=A0A372LG00_9BACI|nr:ribulokinase [Peribacillus glennii]RFU65187.1 ribulokinase [Peribacillus glennii]
METKFVFGIDFGTESARAILVNASNGEMVASSVNPYPHGVITDCLPDTDIALKKGWALQDPRDYLHSLKACIKGCLLAADVEREQVIGIGIDFTASTILPIKQNGEPLCFREEFKENPHSWVKLWKHHAAYKEAKLINETAYNNNEPFIKRYGGEISEEWMFPKILQVLNEATEIYNAADRFIEAGDWIVMQLTGKENRSSCMAGYKGSWSKRTGYPKSDFFKTLHPQMENVVDEKLTNEILPIGSRAGLLSKEIADELGLSDKVAVATGIIDAHAAVLGAGISNPGTMVMAMGTSICHMCIDEKEVFVPGISGVVEDGIIPGYYAYEAGQSAGGDTFSWFMKNCIPKEYQDEADNRGISIYQLMEEKASRLGIGETGVIALDWWNGDRLLKDPNLTGTLIGLTLNTKPEHIYRALMESLAFGTRKILTAFNESGINIEELYAGGGLAEKNRLLMQMFADISGKNVHVVTIPHASAMGSAVLAAVAAGAETGGWDSVQEAINKMIHYKSDVYLPISENMKEYDDLFAIYESVSNYFGKETLLMKSLMEIQSNSRQKYQ